MSRSYAPSPARDEWGGHALGITLNRDDRLDEAELAELAESGLNLTNARVAARAALRQATEQLDAQISAAGRPGGPRTIPSTRRSPNSA